MQMCFGSLEQPLTLHSDEIFKVMIKFNQVQPITGYVGAENREKDETVVGHAQQVNDTLNDLNNVFKSFVANRFYLKLKRYCQAAIKLSLKLFDSIDNISYSYNEIIDSIKLDKDYDFCVVSFLYDLSYDVDGLLHVIFILKIIELYQISMTQFRNELEHIFKTYSFPDDRNNNDIDQETFEKNLTEKSTSDLIAYLSELRAEIQKDSELFCLPTTVPLMDMNLYYNEFNNPRADFIDTIFNSNKSFIYVSTIVLIYVSMY